MGSHPYAEPLVEVVSQTTYEWNLDDHLNDVGEPRNAVCVNAW